MRQAKKHRTQRIGWLRAAVLGAKDGIVSTASLIVGVAAAESSRNSVLVAGMAGLVAGAMSMAAGEYVSVSSQADTEGAELKRERGHLASNDKTEHAELAAIYVVRGLEASLATQVASQLMAKDALGAHARDELGITDTMSARPVQAALASACYFVVGAALPLLLVFLVPVPALVWTVSGSSLLILALLGFLAARAGGSPVWPSIGRVTFWGVLAMALRPGWEPCLERCCDWLGKAKEFIARIIDKGLTMKMTDDDFLVQKGKKVNLDKWPTKVKRLYRSKKNYHELLDAQVKELSALQRMLYASNRHALLLILHGMDSAGKDGTIRHVMSGVNPQGCQVFSFRHPSAEELDHDFLWRTNYRLPERGMIGIFNRSYYEEVLIVRVHPEILHSQNLPDGVPEEPTIWQERYRSIVDLEAHLHRNGTRIIKFFLHISKEEQRKRFLDRIDEPEKNWKFSEADIEERKFWPQYIQAYEACMSATSTAFAPWYVVPADDKMNARLIISQIILNRFHALKMRPPEVDAKRQQELLAIRRRLAEEDPSNN